VTRRRQHRPNLANNDVAAGGGGEEQNLLRLSSFVNRWLRCLCFPSCKKPCLFSFLCPHITCIIVSIIFLSFFLTFCWPCCISVYLSQCLTNLMHKICFTVSFISCLYMFRAYLLIIRRSKLHYTASGIITNIGGRLVHETACYCTEYCRQL